MSPSPPPGPNLPRLNKFVGESFSNESNVRTIFAGSDQDAHKRDHRVIILIGPKSEGKSDLIDFLCSHFYGSSLENNMRFHIADEKFGQNTPQKEITTYIFNDALTKHKPIVIDTPGTGEHRLDDNLDLIGGWLADNNRMRIDVIGVVLSADSRMTTQEENQLQKTLELFPLNVRSKLTVFLVGSDGSPAPMPLLRRLNLQSSRVFKINTGCLNQCPHAEALKESLRTTLWKMSWNAIEDLILFIESQQPVTISGLSHEKNHFPGSVKDSSSEGSVSSRDTSMRGSILSNTSMDTVIHRPTTEKVDEDFWTTTSYERFGTLTRDKEAPPTAPPPPPPLPSPPEVATMASSSSPVRGPPAGLLEEIRNSEKAIGKDSSSPPREEMHKDVVVVDYKDADPEIVLVKHNRPPPLTSTYDTIPIYQHETLPDLPPPMTPLNRPFEVPKSVTVSTDGNTVTRFSSTTVQREVPHVYRDETTPPLPSTTIPQTRDVTSTYSTVAYLNDNGTMTTDNIKTYTPSSRSEHIATHLTPASPYGTSLTNQLRHSHEDLSRYSVVGTSIPVLRDSKPQQPPPAPPLPPQQQQQQHQPYQQQQHNSNSPTSDELRQMNRQSRPSTNTDSPVGDSGDVLRYVYETSSRSYVPHVVGLRTSTRLSRTDMERRKRESRSLEATRSPRHSVYDKPPDEPFYSGGGIVETRHPSPQRHSTHSLHRISGPELVHSEDNYGFIEQTSKPPLIQSPRETMIDFRSPTESITRPFSLQDPAPVPARRTSLGRKSTSDKPRIDMRENPSYSIDPNRRSDALLRERDAMLRKTREDVQRDSYPNRSNQPSQYQNLPLQKDPSQQQRQSQYDQPPQRQQDLYQNVPGNQASPTRNEVIIPPQMRNGQPIHMTIDMKEKQRESQLLRQPQLPAHQYKDSDYGDNWDDRSVRRPTPQQHQNGNGVLSQLVEERQRQTTTMQRASRPDNLDIRRTTTTTTKEMTQVNDPRSPPPPPYNNRPYPSTPREGYASGVESDVERGVRQTSQERRPLRGVRTTGGTKKTVTTTRTASRRVPSQKSKKVIKKTTTKTKTASKSTSTKNREAQIKFLNWSPSNCANPRDCCLNLMFFLVAPLVIIGIIVTVVVISVTNKKNDRYYYDNNSGNYNNGYNSYYNAVDMPNSFYTVLVMLLINYLFN